MVFWQILLGETLRTQKFFDFWKIFKFWQKFLPKNQKKTKLIFFIFLVFWQKFLRPEKNFRQKKFFFSKHPLYIYNISRSHEKICSTHGYQLVWKLKKKFFWKKISKMKIWKFSCRNFWQNFFFDFPKNQVYTFLGDPISPHTTTPPWGCNLDFLKFLPKKTKILVCGLGNFRPATAENGSKPKNFFIFSKYIAWSSSVPNFMSVP